MRTPSPRVAPGPADLQQRLGNAGAQSWLTAQVAPAAPQVAPEVAREAVPPAVVEAAVPELKVTAPLVSEEASAASATLTVEGMAANEAGEVPGAIAQDEEATTETAGPGPGGVANGGAQPITDAGTLRTAEEGEVTTGVGATGIDTQVIEGGGAVAEDAMEIGAVTGGAGGGGTEVELLMPPPPEGLSEADTGRLNTVSANTRSAAAAQEQLPSAGEGVAEARAAVTEPVAETAARAEGELVAALGEQPAPSPEIEALCTRMREVIHSRQPPDEESLMDSVPREEAEAAGQTLETAVESDTDQVRSGYDEMGEAPAGERQQTGEDLNTPAGSVDTPAIGAEQAVPDAVPDENVSLDADTKRSAAAIEDAGMESEPAQLVEGGPIAEARDAQGELGELAERGPEEVLAEQSAERDSAVADMAALQAQALEALTSSRASSASTLGTQQTGMVTTEEQLRTQISTQARTIFTTVQTRVDTLLEPLVPTAIRRWETEIAILSGRFETDLRQVKSWLDERYSGVGGTVLELWEGVVGKPDWVTRAYNRAEENFGDGVCTLLREISTEINTVIATCEQIVDDANTQIEQLFSDLPEGLQEWADSERTRYAEELGSLHNRVTAARDSLTRDLAGRAAGAVQEVRERIHELRQAAGGLVGRVMDAVNRFLDDPIKFIIEGLLELVGIPPASFWAVVNKIQSVISDIADDPLNFANNLASALGQGFQRFFDNFADHILGGFFDWLFSGLGAVGVTIPSDFSLKSIITFFLELMGITWPNIRQILARHIGEENVALIEKAYEIVANLIEMGPEGIFEMIKEQLNPQNILDMVIDAAIDFMIDALIMAVTPRIIAMFNPAGALVQALEVVYRILKWIFENAARIFSLIETVVNGAAELIAGNLSGMATAVEGALARLIAPVIDFLAGFLGLGDLPDKIADTIRGFQEMVLGIIDRVVAWLADRAKALLQAMGIGGEDEDQAPDADGGYDGQVGRRVSFEGGGETHHLYVEVTGGQPTLVVESAKQHLAAFLSSSAVEKAFPDERRHDIVVGAAKRQAASTEMEAENVQELIEQATDASAEPDIMARAAQEDDELEAAQLGLADNLALIFNALASGTDDELYLRLKVRVERLAERATRVAMQVDNDSRLKAYGHEIEPIHERAQSYRAFVDEPADLVELEDDIADTEDDLARFESERVAPLTAVQTEEEDEQEPPDPTEVATRFALISPRSRTEIAAIPDGTSRLAEHDDVRRTSDAKALSIRQELAVAVDRQRRATRPEQEVQEMGREVTRGGHPVPSPRVPGGPRPATELDVVTGVEQIDVKGGDFSARASLNAKQREQIRTQVRIARRHRRTPVLVHATPVSPGVREEIESMGATVEEGIDMSVLN